MKILDGGIENVEGFSSIGKHIGIKNEGKKDFALLYADKPCQAAGVYTKNQIKGAPLLVSINHLKNGVAQAIVINSGNANVANGEQGVIDAENTTKLVAQELSVKKENVLVASTGVIGVPLPFEKIKKGIKGAKNELTKKSSFAEAILTTDTFIKEICVEVDGFKIAGVAKGSGMIEPNMATMLAFIVTDAQVSSGDLQKYLVNSTNKSFNMVSVDTDTSTSDMAIVMSSGTVPTVQYDNFAKALDFVCLNLAKMIAKDGEGATKLIECEVNGAAADQEAKMIAKSVINSPLVKTAVYGNDPNWGRIMMAIGKTNCQINEQKIDIYINEQKIVSGGQASEDYDDEKLSKLMQNNKETYIKIDLNIGDFAATAFGCDMSEQYIKINAEYKT